MNNREIVKRSKKILTNKFTGMEKEKVSNAIMDKFQFNIENETSTTQKLAIIPGYLDRVGLKNKPGDMTSEDITAALKADLAGFSAVKTVDFTGESTTSEDACTKASIEALCASISIFLAGEAPGAPSVSRHKHNTDALNAAGYPVNVILDDAEIEIEKGKLFKMYPANATKKIADFLEFVKTNPIMLKEMSIISNDKSAFASDMEVAVLDPFKRNPEELIDMNQFYSKYQFAEDRIDLKFDKPMEISDVLLWCMNVPAGAKMSIILRF